MTLRESIKDYRDVAGLVSPDKNPSVDSTGNGLLYTSLYYVQLAKQDTITLEDCKEFTAIYESCLASQVRGLLHRSPTKKWEQNSFDDYIGVSEAARILNPKIAWEIVNHGNRKYFLTFKWVYNNLNPGKWSGDAWLGRQPQFTTHIQRCAGGSGVVPHIFRKVWSCIALALGDIDHHGAVILKWIMFNGKENLYLRIAKRVFEYRMKKRYTGYEHVVRLHLGDDHPIAKHWVD